MRLRITPLFALTTFIGACHSPESDHEAPAHNATAQHGGEQQVEAPQLSDIFSSDVAQAQDLDVGAGMIIDDITNGAEDFGSTVEASFIDPASSALASGSSQDDPLADASERARLMQQRRDLLAQQYLGQGDELLDRGDLTGALASYSSALDIDPGNDVARTSLRKVESLMGDRFQSAGEFFENATQRESVRRAQARIAVEDAVANGNRALAGGDYEDAIDAYREGQLILDYYPLVDGVGVSSEQLAELMQEAVDLEQESQAEAERVATQRAADVRQAKEDEQRDYRENTMVTLFNEANGAFLGEDYKRAEDLARQVLLIDPHNEAASELAEIARISRHRQVDARNRSDHREQWIRTFEELSTNDLPQIEPLEFDRKRWAEVSKRKPLEFNKVDAAADEARQAVLDRLETVRFAPTFVGPDGEGAPIEEVASFLQDYSGVNFIISAEARELDEEDTIVKLQLNERSVRKVLDIISETRENLRWKIEDGVVKFVTRDEMLGGQVLRIYEVRDIIHPIPDFPGRDINVAPSGGLELAEEDIEEREGLVVTADALESLINDNISPESWEEDPRNSIRVADNGALVVNQTPEVHEQISQLLDDLREATGIMVDIQSNFLTVEDNFLEDIGVDFRGLGQPGLGTNEFFNDFGDSTAQGELGSTIGRNTDLGAFFNEGNDGDIRARTENLFDSALGDSEILTGAGGLSFQWTYLSDLQIELILRAVSKSERIELVTAPRLTVFNTARANITVLNQVAYVRDFDVEIAQGASIADPIIDVIQDGVVLDVRPVVSADRRHILMELRPTVAQLQRPILEQPTSLGSQQSVTIQLPELDIQRVRTTVPMPDGATVMLGGLRVSQKEDQQSGLPILNKVPVVSFFFERKGTFISHRKLLILIKANIVILSEHEPTPSQLGFDAR